MELENNLENNLEIKNEQNNFIKNSISNIINNAIDIGIRAILPDLIEDQVINIKNSLLENGLKAGIETATNSVIDFGKSIKGIFTGEFENIKQINYAISNGGIIDTVSDLIDFAADKAYNLSFINNTIKTAIKEGKNIILDNVSNNIEKEITSQTNLLNTVQEHVDNWKNYYSNKDFNNMEKEVNYISSQKDKIVPIENLIKEINEIETLHNLIKNNNQNFDISEQEIEAIKRLN